MTQLCLEAANSQPLGLIMPFRLVGIGEHFGEKIRNSEPYFKLIFLSGHMVAANHMDENTTTIKESMHLTNIMPQTAILNRGAYLAAEEVFECWRDIVNLNTIVGIIMGDNDKNDHFVDSHGVKTPDYYWRIIEKEKDRDVIAWIFVSKWI